MKDKAEGVVAGVSVVLLWVGFVVSFFTIYVAIPLGAIAIVIHFVRKLW